VSIILGFQSRFSRILWSLKAVSFLSPNRRFTGSQSAHPVQL